MINYPDYKYDLVCDIIEVSGSIVHKDVFNSNLPGVNYIVEIIENEMPINKTIGLLVIPLTDCVFDKGIHYNIPDSHFAYYSQNELSILFVVVNEENSIAYWEYIELPQLNRVKFNVEKLFCLDTFNLDIIPFVLYKKPLLSSLKENLTKSHFEELLKFLQTNFDFIDLALPYVLKNIKLEDFLQDTGLNFKIYNVESVDAMKYVTPINDGVEITMSGKYTWWIKNKNIIHISIYSIIQLNQLYEELKTIA